MSSRAETIHFSQPITDTPEVRRVLSGGFWGLSTDVRVGLMVAALFVVAVGGAWFYKGLQPEAEPLPKLGPVVVGEDDEEGKNKRTDSPAVVIDKLPGAKSSDRRSAPRREPRILKSAKPNAAAAATKIPDKQSPQAVAKQSPQPPAPDPDKQLEPVVVASPPFAPSPEPAVRTPALPPAAAASAGTSSEKASNAPSSVKEEEVSTKEEGEDATHVPARDNSREQGGERTEAKQPKSNKDDSNPEKALSSDKAPAPPGLEMPPPPPGLGLSSDQSDEQPELQAPRAPDAAPPGPEPKSPSPSTNTEGDAGGSVKRPQPKTPSPDLPTPENPTAQPPKSVSDSMVKPAGGQVEPEAVVPARPELTVTNDPNSGESRSGALDNKRPSSAVRKRVHKVIPAPTKTSVRSVPLTNSMTAPTRRLSSTLTMPDPSVVASDEGRGAQPTKKPSRKVIAQATPITGGAASLKESGPLSNAMAERRRVAASQPFNTTTGIVAESDSAPPAMEFQLVRPTQPNEVVTPVNRRSPGGAPNEQFVLVKPRRTRQTVLKPNSAARGSVQVVSYDVESYVVLAGDTFESIADAMYGSRDYGPVLAHYNRAVARGTLISGVRIRIPPAKVLRRVDANLAGKPSPSPRSTSRLKPVADNVILEPVTKHASAKEPLQTGADEGPARAASSAAADNHASVADRKAVAGPTYKVEKRETLFGIAYKVLGDGTRWREIYKLNADRLDNEYSIPVGVNLRLPPDARTSGK